MPDARPPTFVLVHGAWHGGWCWSRVAPLLREAGHRVFTPTQTGLGERKHLMSRDITLDVFIADVINVIEMEELSDLVMVGHSFAGSVISGVADRMPDRVRHLVYLDSLMIEAGKSPIDIATPELAAARIKAANESSGGMSLPVPPPSAFGVSDPDDAAWLERRLTPHPFGTYLSPLNLTNPVGNGRPRTYVHCTAPIYAPLENSRRWVRSQPGWAWLEIATGHNAMISAPRELAELLLAIAQRQAIAQS